MDTRLQDFAEKAISFAENSGAQYCDVRAEQQEQKSVFLENNHTEFVRSNEDKGLGIRMIKDGIWNFCSITNPKTFDQIKDTISNSLKNVINKNENKNKIELYPNISKKIQIDYPVLKKPDLDEIVKVGLECNGIISETPKIIKSISNPRYTITASNQPRSKNRKAHRSIRPPDRTTARRRRSPLRQIPDGSRYGRSGFGQPLARCNDFR